MTRIQGLYIKRADTWRARLQYEDINGNVIDLAGCSATMALRDADGVEALRVSTDTGELILDTSGELTLVREMDRLISEVAAITDPSVDPIDRDDLAQQLRDARSDAAAIESNMVLDRLDTLQLTVPAATMADMAIGTYHADVEMSWSDGSVLSSPTFLVIILPDQTQ
jgi:homogentisate 1,2-dioxygenase